jgi:hypothetical protein
MNLTRWGWVANSKSGDKWLFPRAQELSDVINLLGLLRFAQIILDYSNFESGSL